MRRISLLLLLSGCGVRMSANDESRRMRMEWQGRTAVLEREHDFLWRLVELDPEGDPAWVFQSLDPRVRLRTPAGVLPHPDPAVVAELKKLPGRLAMEGLARLRRLESRCDVAAASRDTAAVLDAVYGGQFLAPTPEGAPPGGALPDALYAVMAGLAARPDVDADRLASRAPSIGDDSLESRLLVALIGRASVAAILNAARSGLSRPDEWFALLDALAHWARPGPDADAIAAACPSIAHDPHESRVLVALAPKAAVERVLAAAGHLAPPEEKRAVLLALAGRKDLTEAEADRVADAVPGIGYDSMEADVLLKLAGRASRGAIERAAAQIESPEQRRRVLK